MTGVRRIIISSTIIGIIAKIIGVTVNLITMPLILAYLGKHQYGVWVLIGQAIQFLAFTDLGVSNAVGRFVARFRASNDREAINKLVTTVLTLQIVTCFMVILITLIVSRWIAYLLNIEAAVSRPARLVFIISGISLGILFPCRIGQGILKGFQNYNVTNLGNIVGSVMNLGGIILLARLNRFGLVELAIVSAIALAASQIYNVYEGWKVIRPVSLKPGNFSMPLLRDVFSLGGSALMITTSAMIYRQGIAVAVGIILDTVAAGIYGLVLSMITNLQFLLNQIAGPMTTIASEFHAFGQMDRLRKINNSIMKVCFALGISAAAAIWFYGEPFLRLFLQHSDWNDNDFHQAGLALQVMSLGLAIGLPQMVARSVLQGVGYHWQVANRFFMAAIISFSVAAVLMLSGLGITAAAIGWSLILILQGIWLYPPLINRFLEQSVNSMLTQAYLPGLAAGAATFMVGLFFTTILKPIGIFQLVLGVLVSILTAAGAIIIANKELLRRAR